MAGSEIVYEWLGRWEELLGGHEPADLDAFVERNCREGDPGQIAEFRSRAARLRSLRPVLHPSRADVETGAGAPGSTHPQDADPADLRAGQEVVPGYLLERFLGGGGFGKVWQARSPSGDRVALKFVQLAACGAWKEQRGVEVVRQARHPHLLTVLGTWRAGGYLVIAMELADRTLLDRLRQAEKEGLPGVPRDELLRYFGQAADALDHLNRPHPGADGREVPGNQHRDIKPQNMLLVGDTLKIGDFGLARCLEDSVASHTGGLTPKYAAPEFFEDRFTSASDQYCLAVSWCELRGGRLPFDGSPMKLMAGHISGEPDLTMLPPAERTPVSRALAKQPKERWPSCADFVAALRACTDLEALRSRLRADPMNAPLRRLYLALRTPELKEKDRKSASLVISWLMVDLIGIPMIGMLLYRHPSLADGTLRAGYVLWWSSMLLILLFMVVWSHLSALRLRRRLRVILGELGPLGPVSAGVLRKPLEEVRKIYLEGRGAGSSRPVA